jgi:hypothetical protein
MSGDLSGTGLTESHGAGLGLRPMARASCLVSSIPFTREIAAIIIPAAMLDH